jgi:hypothetical protein
LAIQTKYPAVYLRYNSQQTKKLSIVLDIEGLPDKISLSPLYDRIVYGDPDLVYGLPGLVYGGLKRRKDVKDYLSLETSLTVSQKLEPEQGRASISSFSFTLIDKNGYATKLMSPGILIPEPLGGPQCRVWLGFQESAFPDDFFVVFRGTMSQTKMVGPKLMIDIADSNQKTRQMCFRQSTTVLTAPIDAVVTTIPVGSTDGFFKHILGPNGSYDTDVKTFILIDSETMSYGPTGIVDPTDFLVSRAQKPIGWSPVTADVHSAGTSVTSIFQFGNTGTGINPLTAALKLMLSGWNGPYVSAQPVLALGQTYILADPSTNVIHLPLSVDATEDYGVVAGDYIYITGSTNGNDGTYTVVSLADDASGRPNRIIKINANLNPEPASPAVFAIRSQFDTLPVAAGLKMSPKEVDVQGFIDIRNRYLSSSIYRMSFAIDSDEIGKSFIESELFLPIGAYSLTRYGRSSVGYTRPPIPGIDKLVVIDADTVIDPNEIALTRGLNTRRFYNEVTYDFDKDNQGQYASGLAVANSDSLTLIKQTSVLPIKSAGMRASYGGASLASQRARAFLLRYAKAAFEIDLKVNLKAGSVVESGDIIVLNDLGTLKIPNLVTGERDLGSALLEVLERGMDLKTGKTTLKLLSGIVDTRQDRYGVWTPSSKTIGASSTTTKINIKSSYGAIYGDSEFKKWVNYVGLKIEIHSRDYVFRETVTLTGFDTSNQNILLIDPPLSVPPGDDYVVDLEPYSDSTDPKDQQYAKLLHFYWSASVLVTSGTDDFHFDVGAGDVAKFLVGAVVMVRNTDYSVTSDEVKVTDVTGTTITVDKTLTFTPTAGMRVEFIGFADKQGAYRWQ